MEKKTETSPYQTLRWISAIGLGMVVAVVGLLGMHKEFVELFKRDVLHFAEAICLSLISIGLFLQYWWNTSYELDMLTEHVGETNASRIKVQTYIVIMFLGIFFGILISFSINILVYCMCVIVYSLLDFWGSWQVLQTIRPQIEQSLRAAKPGRKRRIIETIHFYYFENPTLPRIVTIMFFSWIAFTFALLAIYVQGSSRILQLVAYAIAGLNLGVGELVITIWRKKRDRAIEAIERDGTSP